MAHDNELDIDLDVFEQPMTPNFPRRPNVVSRRGHRVRFIVYINEVADEETKHVTISASVFNYGPNHLGQESHVSRSRKLWGREHGRLFDIDPDDLPSRHEIVVSQHEGDEHLGQGPYEAIITVSPSTEPPADPTTVTEGDQFSIAFESM